jgi:hypothetical protein
LENQRIVNSNNYKKKEIIKMKITITILVFILNLILFQSCIFENDSKINNAILHDTQTVLIVIPDISKSVENYWNLDTTHLGMIYHKIGESGGGIIYGLFIKTNSLRQQPISASVPSLETIPLQGNAIQRANRKRKNKEHLKSFNDGKDEFISITSKLIHPKNEDFSDVENALILAEQIFENPNYKEWRKLLLIISDMEHDLPPKHGLDKMNPVKFEQGVTIAVVRPSEKINLQQVLPGAVKYVTIDDAIKLLFNERSY